MTDTRTVPLSLLQETARDLCAPLRRSPDPGSPENLVRMVQQELGRAQTQLRKVMWIRPRELGQVCTTLRDQADVLSAQAQALEQVGCTDSRPRFLNHLEELTLDLTRRRMSEADFSIRSDLRNRRGFVEAVHCRVLRSSRRTAGTLTSPKSCTFQETASRTSEKSSLSAGVGTLDWLVARLNKRLARTHDVRVQFGPYSTGAGAREYRIGYREEVERLLETVRHLGRSHWHDKDLRPVLTGRVLGHVYNISDQLHKSIGFRSVVPRNDGRVAALRKFVVKDLSADPYLLGGLR